MSEETKPSITVKEFRMWLEGVEEMQADGWVPDERQWQRIRNKIDTIISIEAVTQTVAFGAGAGGSGPTPRTAQPALFTPPPIISPAGPSLLSGALPPGPPRSQPQPPSAVNPLFSSAAASMPVKTPDIDTGNGKPYESSFA